MKETKPNLNGSKEELNSDEEEAKQRICNKLQWTYIKNNVTSL